MGVFVQQVCFFNVLTDLFDALLTHYFDSCLQMNFAIFFPLCYCIFHYRLEKLFDSQATSQRLETLIGLGSKDLKKALMRQRVYKVINPQRILNSSVVPLSFTKPFSFFQLIVLALQHATFLIWLILTAAFAMFSQGSVETKTEPNL